MGKKILDLAIHVLYLKVWVTYLMSNSLNRLQQGGRSAGLEAFLRQCGGRPDPFFVLGESNRLPREGVDRCNGERGGMERPLRLFEQCAKPKFHGVRTVFS